MLEGYDKIRTIGKGSFGTASLCTRLKDNKLVVLKEITTSDMDHEEKSSSYSEIEILSALNHPNVIRYFDSIIKQDYFIIIMDYADGGNLMQLINLKKSKNEIFKEKGILFIVFQISAALSYIHSKKILHRDLKSANIFITSNGTIKVGDFGISKMLSTKSQAETVVGTPYYLSPEMCEGHQYDEKSDIWALGCILYEMTTLKKPFNAPNLPLLVQRIIRCDYDDIPNYYCKDMKTMLELILQKNRVFRPTAKFIHDVIIPDILSKNGIKFDYDNITGNSEQNRSTYKERSIIYEITNVEGEINIEPKLLPHKKILDFSICSTHSVVIFEDHNVYAWGSNKYCELGVNNADIFIEHPVYVKSLGHLNIIKCAVGDHFSLFLTKHGQIYSCGHGSSGCLGHGNLGNVYFPILIRTLSKITIKDLVCGNRHVTALDKNGKIYIWGFPQIGQHGLENSNKTFTTPLRLEVLREDIKKIFCSNDATILLSEHNSLYVSGNNRHQKLGIKEVEYVGNFRKFKHNYGEVIDISMSTNHTVIVNSKGELFSLGDNSHGQLGKKSGIFRRSGSHLELENRIMKSSCSDTFTCVFDEKNILWLWGTMKRTKPKHKENESTTVTLKNQTILSLYSRAESCKNKIDSNENVSENNFFFEEDMILERKSILALYSSKDSLKAENYIKMSNIKATENAIFLMADTTCPAPFKGFSGTYNINSFGNTSYTATRTYNNILQTK